MYVSRVVGREAQLQVGEKLNTRTVRPEGGQSGRREIYQSCWNTVCLIKSVKWWISLARYKKIKVHTTRTRGKRHFCCSKVDILLLDYCLV